MKQIYYVIQTLLRGRGSNIIKVISLGLGLTMSCLLYTSLHMKFPKLLYPSFLCLLIAGCDMIDNHPLLRTGLLSCSGSSALFGQCCGH